ncbi:MAG: FMN-binding negative transcriptional regulator [Brucellaceae bacterium]|nr:FMN-binding negative transcriptional regulator [Brucellaceae bacterium]
MYMPSSAREERRDVLIAAMRDIQFAALVSSGPEGLHATHLPILLREEGDDLLIEAHVAKGNPHWKLAGAPTLAIFQGPQAYIHPGWYESKKEHGRVVPTWTYIAVHAHGSIEAFDAQEELLDHVGRLTSQNEEKRAEPWAVTDAPEKYLDAMTRAIVGIRMRVERIEGSWKLNQHKSDADRAGVVSGLAAEERAGAQAISAQMQALEAARPAGER